MDYKEVYESWLSNPYFDEKTKEELRGIAGDENEIKERFYKELEFGTAGLRGIIGAGTNRMNIYTVRKTTQGLANYILSVDGQSKGVAIAYDSRRMSPEFANEAALCLAANGIKAYIFESLRPTPELSYAVRKLGCIAGGIMAEVGKVTDFAEVKTMPREEAEKAGLYQVIGQAVDDSYMAELKSQVLHMDSIQEMADQLKIVYTPLHGTGNIPARRVLKELGFNHVYVVKEQELPDGEFPTVSYPNPEAEEAFALGLKLAKEVDADLVLATDPDADRLGVRVKDAKTGEYHTLTGNMSGCLLADYEIGQKKALKGLPEDGALITTIVSTNMAGAIARYYGVKLIEVLTGFKYIGQQIGTHARDKDAIVATMALCEAAAYYKSKGMTLWDAMIQMYERYGYYKDDIKSITLKGIEGLAKIQEIMDTLRKNPPKQIGAYKVTATRDYKEDKIVNLATGETGTTGLPSSNVLYYDLEDDAWLCVRPSGTEPKIKFYYGIKGTSLEDADAKSEAMGKDVLDMIQKML